MPYKTWVTGEEVLAADFNNFVQEQVVASMPNAAGRDTDIPAPNEGQLVYLRDTDILQVHDGTVWKSATDAPVVYGTAMVGAAPNPNSPLRRAIGVASLTAGSDAKISQALPAGWATVLAAVLTPNLQPYFLTPVPVESTVTNLRIAVWNVVSGSMVAAPNVTVSYNYLITGQ